MNTIKQIFKKLKFLLYPNPISALDALKRDSCFDIESLKSKVDRLERDQSEKDALFKILTNDYRNACQANLSLLEEKEEFDTEAKALREEIENLHKQKLELNLQLVDKYRLLLLK